MPEIFIIETRKMYNKYKTNYYENLLKVVSKNHKQTLNTQSKRFKMNRVAKLKSLKSNTTPRSTGNL